MENINLEKVKEVDTGKNEIFSQLLEEKTLEEVNDKHKSLHGHLKNVTIKWLKSSTSHGLPRIFETNNVILKTIWLFAFLSSTTYMIYSIIILINEYFRYPTNMLMRFSHVPTVQFPAIELPTLRELSLSKYCKTNYNSSFCSPHRSASSYSDFSDYAKTNLSKNISDAYMFEIGDKIKYCRFNSIECDLKKDFILDPETYTFNKEFLRNGTKLDTKNISLTETAKGGGLVLFIFFGDPDFENIQSFVISIDQQINDFYSDENDIFVPPGYSTEIVINRNVFHRLEKPHGNCIKDLSKTSKFNSTSFHYISRVYNLQYTKRLCFSLCTARELALKCNCTRKYDMWKAFNKLQKCEDIKNKTCADTVSKTIFYENICIKECPDECESIEYSLTSRNFLLGKSDFKDYKNYTDLCNLSEENLSKAFGVMRLNYATLEYTENIYQISMSFQTLISNIGGHFGLCIGITMISGVEIIVLMFDIVQILFNHFKLKI